jgi:nucleoside-diphosphate-sugar epimerase
MQTILGSGGIIGTELAKNLTQYTEKIRLVSRSPEQVNPTDETMSANLINAEQVNEAVKGAEVVYLTVGLVYKLSVWEKQWPAIMTNVINACKQHDAKLVFFDNVYMYGKLDGWMTEETPMNPCSKKGEIRARIAQQLMDEVSKGSLTALIARSADFYGPNAMTTFVHSMVFEKLKNGKKAYWLVNDKVKHSHTYTPDAGKATSLLGNTERAFNQIWHLPTDRNVLTGQEFIEKVAQAYHVKPKYSVMRKWTMKMAGLFNPLAKESIEMLYQNEYDYLFDSTKFEETFFKATPYETGIKKIVGGY